MPTPTKVNPTCDIELLILASQSAYRVQKSNKVSLIDYGRMRAAIDQKGYKITEDAITPKNNGGTGTTPLAATCLVPSSGDGPIVIAFRGTKTKGDIASDLLIGASGVVEKKFRDAAFEYYKKISAKYPNRPIILTGHSLGGNLAQYVAVKACNTAIENPPDIQVRTFNTAPIKTTHSAFFNSRKHPRYSARIVNYRLSSDIVSDLPLKSSYGNIFSFPCKNNFIKAHFLASMLDELPRDILSQEVGGSARHSIQHNLLEEQVRGILQSYQCRIEGQWFSKYRQGTENLASFKRHEEKLLDAIRHENYSGALGILHTLNCLVSGQASKHIVEVLTTSVKTLRSMQMEALENSSIADNEAQEITQVTKPVEENSSNSLSFYKQQIKEIKISNEDTTLEGGVKPSTN